MNIHLLKMEKLKTSPLPSAPRSVPGGGLCASAVFGEGRQRHISSRGSIVR